MSALALWFIQDKLGRFVGIVLLCLAAYVGGKALLAWHDANVRGEALAGYVLKSQLDAAEATNREIARQLEAGRKSATLYAELLAEAQERERLDDEHDKQRNAIYAAQLAAQGRSCRITQSDRDFVRER
ncbi:hypothetical protein ASD50_07780 [Mesorhizobium sp. Root552]|jgi:hypothetical protein|uniref:hypothetical protein n=1 Tax=Mesorhizobium sp. Root552 TaxID=1736555 RepID=UPI0006F812AA|nr:hypothetical protein [Mesorhizobium sp. Root552]KQZ19374.1 hypothetical protein ASD50_07780 [Mesorhizobium sp. Root552]